MSSVIGSSEFGSSEFGSSGLRFSARFSVFKAVLLGAAIVAAGLNGGAARAKPLCGKFQGEWVLKPVWNDPVLGKSGKWDRGDFEVQLLFPLTYVACSGKRVTVKKNYVMNGASIPAAAWSLLGITPLSGKLQKPAALHDFETEFRHDTSKEVHARFREALLAEGVPSHIAFFMYSAVAYAGPQWTKPGEEPTYPNYAAAGMRFLYTTIVRQFAARRLGDPSSVGETFSGGRSGDGRARDLVLLRKRSNAHDEKSVEELLSIARSLNDATRFRVISPGNVRVIK